MKKYVSKFEETKFLEPKINNVYKQINRLLGSFGGNVGYKEELTYVITAIIASALNEYDNKLLFKLLNELIKKDMFISNKNAKFSMDDVASNYRG